uniref:Uncharacterized protein n=1 Tax=Candidatus Kentrum sp. SD TaxID=2126332 RepID=A0A450YFZ4_9GAMM|nr:MAG: hypothetical protein BECKSD772F_GA0070984_106012 [Candidatus Kentron sp. SD]VFK45906.1 MAG: hypothetical protein BECKSD772E_GA0070983_106311 [Candidatus Kentron sp. SD]
MNIRPHATSTAVLLAWVALITLFAIMMTAGVVLRPTNSLISLMFFALSALVGGYGLLRAIKGKTIFSIIVSAIGAIAIVGLLILRQWDPDLTGAIRVIAALGFVAVLLWRWFFPPTD